MGGLASEADRWELSAKRLEEDQTNLVGNILLTAACISYLGPFTANYRQNMLQ